MGFAVKPKPRYWRVNRFVCQGISPIQVQR